MASQIDFAIALGLFITFIAILTIYVVNYVTSFSSLATSSELRTVAYDFYNSLFGSKGVPANWENLTSQPVKFGFSGDLFRTPILVTDRSATLRNLTINATITFDFECKQKAWNDSVRVYNDTSELAFQLYNQTFCNTKFLNTSDLVFNITVGANQAEIIYVYYSADTKVANTTYNVSFASPTSAEAVVYPQETIPVAVVSKVNAFRNKTFTDVVKTLALEYRFNLQIARG